MLAASRQPILSVVKQHAEESAIQRNARSVLAFAPHVKLHQLHRLDDRIAAHLDGVAVAGEFGWQLCEAALEKPGTGEVFAAAVRAIEDRNSMGPEKLLALAEAVPESRRGLVSAFGLGQRSPSKTRSRICSFHPTRFNVRSALLLARCIRLIPRQR